MPNENHETYGGNDISTYTDDISGSNTFTNDQIEACVLSAGVAPYSAPLKIVVANYTHEQCTGGPNLYSPFYKESNSNILWYDEGGLGVLENTNYWWYKHCIYVSKTGNKIASSLKVQNYRNFLEIVIHTWADIRGVQHKTYYPRITTKYGTIGDWHESVLQPALLIYNTTDGALAKSVEQTEPQSYWYWGGPSNVQNGMGGGNLFTRGLNNGTVSNDNYAVPWEPTGSDPIRIKEGGSDYTFPVAFAGEHITSTFYGGNPLNLHQGFNTPDDAILFCAFCGLKFEYNETVYKPLANGGVVYGYTNDMSKTSDWDNWRDIGDHTIPVTPPSPGPGPGPGPYDDDPWSGATFAGTGVGGAGAFAKVYYMTSTELANLRSWMNSINVPEGFDPMQQIIGLSQVPVALSGSSPENVVFVNSSAVYDPGVTTRAVDTGVATQQAMGTPISYYLGSVDIVRRMQERGEPYLDYDCQIELYLPLIGMFSLDTQAVMGRTISAYAVLDPVSGTLAAYAYVTKDGQNLPIAYGSTTIGVDLPISAQQLSVSRAALKQANAQLGASLLSGALTMLAAASSGKSSGSGAKTSTGSSGLSAAGIREAGSDYMKASQVGNVFGDFMNWGRTIRQLSYGNNTAVAGSFGGSTAQWAYPFTPYVKIIRPRYEKPSNYAHSQGVPCVQTKTIGSCTGFIQCIGADVSGITGATDLELQAIQAALSNGIYAGGGQ